MPGNARSKQVSDNKTVYMLAQYKVTELLRSCYKVCISVSECNFT